jgi:hypothetical protein
MANISAGNIRPWISWPKPGKKILQIAAITLPVEP